MFPFQCSASCGTGLRVRKVRCYADSRIDYSEKTCQTLKKPASVELCNKHPCSGKISVIVFDLLFYYTAMLIAGRPFAGPSKHFFISSI